MTEEDRKLKLAMMERGAERLRNALAKYAEGHLVDATTEASKGALLFEAAWDIERDEQIEQIEVERSWGGPALLHGDEPPGGKET